MAMTHEDLVNHIIDNLCGRSGFDSAFDVGDDILEEIKQEMSDSIDAHLSAQAKVRVTDEDVETAAKAVYEMSPFVPYGWPCALDWETYASKNKDLADGIRNRARTAMENFAARLSQGAQVSISDALNRLEDMAVAGEQLHGDDVWRFRALVDRIAPQGAQVEEIDCHAVKALDRCVDDLQSLVDTADDMGFDEMTVQSLLTAIESMQLRKRVIQNDGLVGEIVEVKFPNPLDTLDRYVDWRNGVPSAGTKLYAHPAERAAVPDGLIPLLHEMVDLHDKRRCVLTVHMDRVKDMLTAAPQPPEGARVVGGWQPIETAPKSTADGKRVNGIYLLGFTPDAEEDFDQQALIDIIWWEPLLRNPRGGRGVWRRNAGGESVNVEPTHWMPLPAAPTLAGKEG